MKTFTNTTFTGYYPVGSAAVVYASDAQEAADWLNIELKARGLKGDVQAKDMEEFAPTEAAVRILNDGEY